MASEARLTASDIRHWTRHSMSALAICTATEHRAVTTVGRESSEDLVT